MSRVLMVTPFPPQPDGIATYAAQAVRQLRQDGDVVDVLSPGPSAAHDHLAMPSPRGSLALAKRARHYDRVVVQFHPDFYYRPLFSTASISVDSVALRLGLATAREVEVRIHEIDYRWGRRRDAAGAAIRRLWRSVDQIVVHTEKEGADFVEAFGVNRSRISIAPHGAHFRPQTSANREEARASLGIEAEEFCFLSIGFIQPHKGFDRAVRAFASLGAIGTRIDVVGSVRIDHPEMLEYFEELQRLVASTPGASLHPGYVTDELFDRWIAAADVVVLPYREIWSSSVLERALLLGRPVIATDVGGLRHQVGTRPGVTIVSNDRELANALRAVVGLEAPTVDRAWQRDALGSREALQAEVSNRAAVIRGTPVPIVPEPTRRRESTPIGYSRRVALTGLQQIPSLGLIDPRSGRLGTRWAKRLLRRLTWWQLAPLVHHVNTLHDATYRAISEVAQAVEDGTASEGGATNGRTATGKDHG